MVKVQSHEGVAGVQHGEQYGSIGLCSRVGLHVGVLCPEELAYAVDGQLLYLIHHLATSVVAFAGIAFGILVGKA